MGILCLLANSKNQSIFTKINNLKLRQDNHMDLSYDREKVLDCMFDPITSLIIAELEGGEKSSSYLSKKASISNDEVKERLFYLIENGFIQEKTIEGQSIFSANDTKLAEVVENGENFGAAIEGLEKMDSFLN